MKKNREDLVLFRNQYILMFSICILLYIFHMLFPLVQGKTETVFTVFVVGAVSVVLIVGGVFLNPSFAVAKRVIYVVTTTSSFIISYYLGTQSLLVLVFSGLLVLIGNFMDKRVVVESFVFTQLGMAFMFTVISPLQTFITPFNFIVEEYVYIVMLILELRTVNASAVLIDNYKDKATMAQEISESKNIFLANMSHEIRTPLNSIKGLSELLGQRETSPIERQYISSIQKSSDDLLALINNILDYAKIESGSMELAEGVYDLASIINDLSSDVTRKIGKKQVSFIVEVDPTIPHFLKGDQNRVKQILENVLDNAVKFTNSGSIFFGLRWEKKGDTAYIYADITDTGEGIKQSNLQAVFDAFSQQDMTKTRRSEGTGLGLSIVKRLVESMEGDIRLISKDGEGTAVKIEFPQEIPDDRPIVQVDNAKDIRAFIFEPNRTCIDGIKKALASLGIKSEIISDASFAREHIAKAENAYVFFDSRRGAECFSNLAEEFPNHKFISMYNPNTTFAIKETPYITNVARPVTILTLAGVFKGNDNFGLSQDKKEIRMFSAPSARVMVVDDNETNLRVAEGFLLKYNVGITSVSSGYECIKELAKGKYDIIFMDFMMPDMDGVQTTQLIRKRENDTDNHQVVVALTANAVKGADDYLMSLGMDGYIAKPIDSKALNEIMNRFIPEKLKQEYVDEQEIKEEIVNINLNTPNIDVEKGIERMGGSRENYVRILRTAYNEGRLVKEKIQKAFDEKDYRNYIILVHSVKSTMLGMGADDLSAMAKEHESAGKEGRIDFITENVGALLGRMELVLKDMEHILEETDSANAAQTDTKIEGEVCEEEKTISGDELLEKIKEAVFALESFDQEKAAQILAELANLQFEGRETVLEAVSLVDNIEYDEAIEKLNSLIS